MKIYDFYYIEWYRDKDLITGYIRKDTIESVYRNPDGKAILGLTGGRGLLIEASYDDIMIDLFNQ